MYGSAVFYFEAAAFSVALMPGETGADAADEVGIGKKLARKVVHPINIFR